MSTSHSVQVILFFIIGGIVGFACSSVLAQISLRRRLKVVRKESEAFMVDAKRQSESLAKQAEKNARQQYLRVREDFDIETKSAREYLEQLEKRLITREDNIDRKVDVLDQKELDIKGREDKLASKEKELEGLSKEAQAEKKHYHAAIEQVAQMSIDDAKKLVMEVAKEELVSKGELKDQVVSQEALDEDRPDSPLFSIQLPSDEMKGRVIGREGRNIRTLETLTGTAVSVEDQTCRALIWSWDPFRREVAKKSLLELIANGKIFPRVIEETIGKVNESLTNDLIERARASLQSIGVPELHPQLMILVGKLSLQTSYGENVLLHSLEVAKKMEEKAASTGKNADLAKRIGTLHDIGKAVGFDTRENCVKAGVDLLEKYGESAEVVTAVKSQAELNTQDDYGRLLRECDLPETNHADDSVLSSQNYGKQMDDYVRHLLQVDGIERATIIDAQWCYRAYLDLKTEELSDLSEVYDQMRDRLKDKSTLSGKPVHFAVRFENKVHELI